MASKLGPHCLRPNAAAIEMVRAGCKIVKLVDDLGPVESGEIDPRQVTVICRAVPVWPNQDGRVMTAESSRHLAPAVAAKVFHDEQKRVRDANPRCKQFGYWEGWNEPAFGDEVEAYKWYCQAEIERMKLADAEGYKCVIFNWAVGNPGNLDMWQHLLPAVRYARDHGHLIGLHEYGSVVMWWMTGPFQASPKEHEGIDGWVTLRFRKVVRGFFVPAGLGDAKIVITELGLDAVGPSPEGFVAGHWRHCAGQWERWDASRDPIAYWRNGGRDVEQYYAEHLIWYDNEIRKDPNVVGATIYTFQANNPAWEGFRVDNTRIPGILSNWIRSQANIEDPKPAPVPTPTPVPVHFARGIDVSHHQEEIDWSQVTGVDFVIVRVGDGLDVDEQFARNWKAVKDKGLVRSVYQYFRASKDGAVQAHLLLNTVGKLGPGDLPPMVDVETVDGVTPAVLSARLADWVTVIKAHTGLRPIIYTSTGFWSDKGLPAFDIDLWVAHWTDRAQPLIPKGWQSWKFWQHSSKGTMAGIKGDVDLDRFNGTVEELRAYAIQAPNPQPDPEPTPEPTPTPQPDPGPAIGINAFNALSLSDVYAWDFNNEQLPPGERGNTILIPKGLDFNYVWDPNDRISWVDRKPGSPTFGQLRAQPLPNLKPECVIMNPSQAADIRLGTPYTGDLIKCFKGWSAIRVVYGAVVTGFEVGKKYIFTLPVFPDLVMEYRDGTKVFADDPDAGFMRLRALPGNAPLMPGHPDSSWYDGGDFAPGRWKVLELLFDATDTTMTLIWESISTFGLVNSCFFLAHPRVELVPNEVPSDESVKEQVRKIAELTASLSSTVAKLQETVE